MVGKPNATNHSGLGVEGCRPVMSSFPESYNFPEGGVKAERETCADKVPLRSNLMGYLLDVDTLSPTSTKLRAVRIVDTSPN